MTSSPAAGLWQGSSPATLPNCKEIHCRQSLPTKEICCSNLTMSASDLSSALTLSWPVETLQLMTGTHHDCESLTEAWVISQHRRRRFQPVPRTTSLHLGGIHWISKPQLLDETVALLSVLPAKNITGQSHHYCTSELLKMPHLQKMVVAQVGPNQNHQGKLPGRLT